MRGQEPAAILTGVVSVADRSDPIISIRRTSRLVSRIGLPAALFSLFSFAHLSYWLRTGHLTGLVLFAQEALLTGLFIVRRPAFVVSRRPVDWTIATAASFGILLLRPSGRDIAHLDLAWTFLQLVGGLVVLYGSAHLGRSFGIVAANRGVRQSGPYRIVRHPIYAAYLIGEVGYLLSAFSWRNLAVIAAVLAGQVWRIHAEERVLSADVAYRGYAATVRFRLVPGLF